MNAAGLVQMAAARGIDLAHVAGVASKLDGIAQERSLTVDEKKRGLRDVQLTVRGRESRGHRHPSWSAAELGQAAAGLGQVPWAAALYSFAGAHDGYWILHHALVNEAQRCARREAWPAQVVGVDGQRRFYREALAALVLDVDAHRPLFTAAPPLYGAYMNVAAQTWDQQLSDPFRALQSSYDRWLSIARGAIGKWIRGD